MASQIVGKLAQIRHSATQGSYPERTKTENDELQGGPGGREVYCKGKGPRLVRNCREKQTVCTVGNMIPCSERFTTRPGTDTELRLGICVTTGSLAQHSHRSEIDAEGEVS